MGNGLNGFIVLQQINSNVQREPSLLLKKRCLEKCNVASLITSKDIWFFGQLQIRTKYSTLNLRELAEKSHIFYQESRSHYLVRFQSLQSQIKCVSVPSTSKKQVCKLDVITVLT